MRSKFEEDVARGLERVGYEYEGREFKLELRGKQPGRKCATCGGAEIAQTIRYLPDFYIPDYALYIEAKGRFTAKDRKKALAFVAQYPEYKYALLFMRDNALSKASKTRYSDWCEANNITYSIGAVAPKDWFK
jgi:hypothetical protein